MNNLGLGLSLMLIGMVSVFIILIIVILLGKLTIAVTNRFPEEQPQQKPSKASEVSAKTAGIIEAVVKELTAGKGSVKEIVKM